VTSHDAAQLATASFSNVDVVRNLVVNGDFESSTPPSTGPGWTSDVPYRQSEARVETQQPHGGFKDGVCETTAALDCGLYQDVVLPTTGKYALTFYANANKAGVVVGYNLAGRTLSIPIEQRPDGYGASYFVGTHGQAGDVIRIWLYAPASPGRAVIDDVQLVRYLGPT